MRSNAVFQKFWIEADIRTPRSIGGNELDTVILCHLHQCRFTDKAHVEFNNPRRFGWY
jgi:hypothetical protein